MQSTEREPACVTSGIIDDTALDEAVQDFGDDPCWRAPDVLSVVI